MFDVASEQSIRQILLFFPSFLLEKLEDKECSDLPNITEIIGSKKAGTAAKTICFMSLSLRAHLLRFHSSSSSVWSFLQCCTQISFPSGGVSLEFLVSLPWTLCPISSPMLCHANFCVWILNGLKDTRSQTPDKWLHSLLLQCPSLDQKHHQEHVHGRVWSYI